MQSSARVRLVDVISARIERAGVRHVFGVGGANIEDLFAAMLRRQPRLQAVLTKHEHGAGSAADAYARITGGLGVVMATPGGGAMNLVHSLAEARASCVPVLALVGEPPREAQGNGAFQDTSGRGGAIDAAAVFRAVSVWCARAERANEVPALLEQGIDAALRQRGPAVLLLEKNLQHAGRRLIQQLELDPAKDIDILFTNVAVPDEAFTGCGAEVAHRLGCRPRWVIDLHNTGCVAFVYMLELARLILGTNSARGALLCNVQNAGGRVFSQPELRAKSHAPVPGDGAGVGYVARDRGAPLLALAHLCQPEFAPDMRAHGADGRRYWQPGTAPLDLCFDEPRVAAIISRGNRIVPEMVVGACEQAGVHPRELALLVTNQPNPIFLRNWREALELPAERHHDTYARYGNLFGAALPINLDDALACGKLRPGGLVALAGFSHAGDYAAAALLRWQSPERGVSAPEASP